MMLSAAADKLSKTFTDAGHDALASVSNRHEHSALLALRLGAFAHAISAESGGSLPGGPADVWQPLHGGNATIPEPDHVFYGALLIG